MKCKCPNGKYSVRCCLSQGGRGGFPTSSPSSSIPQMSTLGRMSGASARRIDKVGKVVQGLGTAQYANSYRSVPSTSGKIWTQYMRHEVMRKREAHYGAKGASDMRKNPRKYDFRPKSSKNYVAYKDAYRRGRMSSSPREAHRRRSPHWGRVNPNPSPYSVPAEWEINKHRRSQRARGKTKFAIGTTMRGLGKGLLVVQIGVYGHWLYQDPSVETVGKIAKDITLSEQIEEIFLNPIRNWGVKTY